MARCEDYPCCGHEPGDCPDSSGRMKCVECGRRLAKNASSSICNNCLRRMAQRSYDDYYPEEGEIEYRQREAEKTTRTVTKVSCK